MLPSSSVERSCTYLRSSASYTNCCGWLRFRRVNILFIRARDGQRPDHILLTLFLLTLFSFFFLFRYCYYYSLYSYYYYYYDYSAWPLGRAVHLFTCFPPRGLASRVFLKLKVPAARVFIAIIIPLLYLYLCCYSYCNASFLCSAYITRYFYYWHTVSICMSIICFSDVLSFCKNLDHSFL